MKKAEASVTHNDQETRTCEQHGEFEVKSIECFGGRIIQLERCPTCAEEQEQLALEAQEKQKQEESRLRWERKLGTCGIPERFRDRHLDLFLPETQEQHEALLFAKTYAEDLLDGNHRGRCAVFVGRPGTGKTHLAIGIGLKLLEHKKTVLFCTVFRAIRRIKDSWANGSKETETDVINLMVVPDLLILDEMGVQFGSDTEKLMLFDILNERYQQHKSTIMLSNLSLPEIQAYLGERILDRMREDGGEVIPFMWESHRSKLNTYLMKATT